MKIYSVVVGIVIASQAIYADKLVLTQLDENIPEGIRYLDSLRNPSTDMDLPGFQVPDSGNKFRVGYIPVHVAENPVESQQQRVPYAVFEHPFKHLHTGVYAGNLQTNFLEQNATNAIDTIRKRNRDFLSMDGGVWCIPVSGYLKGVSLYMDGTTDYSTNHIAEVDAWKRLHTDISTKMQYGSGTLSGAFSFFGSDYWLVRARFGRGGNLSNRELSDTLYFTNDYFINSTSSFDTSSTNVTYGAELGYVYRNENKKFSIGGIIGQDQTSNDFGSYLSDSASSKVILFFQKNKSFKKAAFYIGGEVCYSGAFYKHHDSNEGLVALVRSYTLHQSQHRIDCSIPFLLEVRPMQQLTLFWGAEVTYRYTTSNFNSEMNVKNFLRDSGFLYNLRPLGIRYSPTSRIAVSLSPSMSEHMFLSSMEASIVF